MPGHLPRPAEVPIRRRKEGDAPVHTVGQEGDQGKLPQKGGLLPSQSDLPGPGAAGTPRTPGALPLLRTGMGTLSHTNRLQTHEISISKHSFPNKARHFSKNQKNLKKRLAKRREVW